MSLVICVHGPEGIALGSDSRRVILRGEQYVSIDDTPKLVTFESQPHVAALVTGYGGGINCLRRALLDAPLPQERVSVREAAGLLVEAAKAAAPERAVLIIAGYDEDGSAHVLVSDLPDQPEPVKHEGYSIVYAGQREFIDRLLQGYDARLGEVLDGTEGLDSIAMKIPLDRITLQGSVELARFLIEMTVGAQRFIEGICGVGGGIHLAMITSEEFRWVERPEADVPRIEWHDILEPKPAVIKTHPDGVRAAAYAVRLY